MSKLSTLAKCSLSIALTTLVACGQANKSDVQEVKKLVKTSAINQTQLNQMANSLDVKYQVLSNLETDCPDKDGKAIEHCFSAYIHLTSPADLNVNNWSIQYSLAFTCFFGF